MSIDRIKESLIKINKLMTELKRMADINKLDWEAEAQQDNVVLLQTDNTPDPKPMSDRAYFAEIQRRNKENKEREARERATRNKKTTRQYGLKKED